MVPAAAGNISFALSLPIASNFAGGAQCGGTAVMINDAGTGPVYADAVNDRMQVDMSNTVTTSTGVWVHATYQII